MERQLRRPTIEGVKTENNDHDHINLKPINDTDTPAQLEMEGEDIHVFQQRTGVDKRNEEVKTPVGPGESGKQPHLGDFCWGGRHQPAVGAGDANRGLAVNTGGLFALPFHEINWTLQ
ncbi:hypothetical protein U0070_020628, partial [Myodes glareolus]